MKKWLTYINERIPPVVYLLLAGGVATTGMFSNDAPRSALTITLTIFGILWFLVLLRMMDEVKDYEKDLQAHPERPLPRGLIAKQSVITVIYAMTGGMVLYSGLTAWLLGTTSGAFYLATTVYLWLMYKEFYIGELLAKRPIVYAVTHQVVMVLLVAFAATANHGELVHAPRTWWAATMALGSFFTYEIARKLDPEAPRILDTYLVIEGRLATTVYLLLTIALTAVSVYELNLSLQLWPIEAILLATISLIYLKPEKFKVVESIATASLVFHLWVLTLSHYTGWF